MVDFSLAPTRLSSQARYKEAERMCRRAIRIDPHYGEAYAQVAVFCQSSCDRKLRVEIAVNSHETWQLGDVFKDSEQITKSVEAYSEGIRLAPAYEVTSPRRIDFTPCLDVSPTRQ